MRVIRAIAPALSLILTFAIGGLALADPAEATLTARPLAPQVSIQLSPELAKKAQDTYGLAEVEAQAERLRALVAEDLQRMGVMAGGQVRLILVDVRPSRPTRQEMSSRPGLSFRSAALGGASIQGQMTSFDGATTPVAYTWYASDLADSRRQSVWGDAQWTFERFSHRLSRGQLYALR